MVFKNLCDLVLRTKVASALEGLSFTNHTHYECSKKNVCSNRRQRMILTKYQLIKTVHTYSLWRLAAKEMDKQQIREINQFAWKKVLSLFWSYWLNPGAPIDDDHSSQPYSVSQTLLALVLASLVQPETS